MSIFSNPVKTTFGTECFEHFLSEIKSEEGNVLLLTGGKSALGVEARIFDALNGKNFMPINKINPNPDVTHIYGHYKKIRSAGFYPDCIFAIGGGSVLDTAKALKAILAIDIKSIDELRNIIKIKDYSPAECRLILCPTSAGTGSEVTKWATVWDNELKLKYSVEHESLYADKAYIDPALTYSLPFKQSVSCAFDAFSHAVESYWSPGSCKISREYSLKAIELFESVIDGFLENCGSEEREIISACGYFAGLAFSHTRTTVCHAISYPLTLLYGIPHGIAACISIPYVLEINRNALTEKDRLFNALDITRPADLKYKIYKRLKSAEICYSLAEYGFNKNDIDSVARKCITRGRSDNNPVKISVDDIKIILEKL